MILVHKYWHFLVAVDENKPVKLFIELSLKLQLTSSDGQPMDREFDVVAGRCRELGVGGGFLSC